MSSSDSSQTNRRTHRQLQTQAHADPSAVAAMLTYLDLVFHLFAGPVSRRHSKFLTFTHMLHSRYRSKPNLASYTDHPAHVSAVANYVRPDVEDAMAVDWVAEDLSGPVEIPLGSAARLTILKVKDESGKDEVLKGVRDNFPSIEQPTAGENLSPGSCRIPSI